MSTGRIVAIAAGLLIAAGAFFLVARSFRGAADAAVPEEAAAGAPDGSKKEDKAPPSGWQSFIQPDARAAPPPRPVVRLAGRAPNPFDRLPEASSGGGAPREQKERPGPGLRLEGISFGAQAVALLSGRAVREGDTVSGYRVVRISRSAVTLTGARGGRVELALRKDRTADGGAR